MRKDQTQQEAVQIWNMLRATVRKEIQNLTKDCVRMKKLTVVTAPNGTTLGVMQPNDTTIFQIPYVSSLSGVQVGQVVLVQYWYGMSNAVAVSLGDGSGL